MKVGQLPLELLDMYEFAFLEVFCYKMVTHATVIVENFITKFYCGSL
jgi:hypothetical protein